MATRLKPTRINVDNTPRVGDGASYQNDDNFRWSAGGGDMAYRDFEWVTLTGNSLVIENISNNVTPTGDFTVSAGTIRPGIEYVLRVNTGATPYTMTLGTGVTNPNLYKTELKPNTVNQFKFIATATNQLELEGVDSAVMSEIIDLQDALDEKGDMFYSDFNWETKTGTAIELSLNSEITPTANFTVNKPADLKDGQTYLLRVNNGATAYTITLGTNVTNPYSEDLTLEVGKAQLFVFMARGGNLELQPSPQELIAGRNIDLTNNVANLKLIDVTVNTAYNVAYKIGTTTAGNYMPTIGDLLLVNFVNGCSITNPTLNIDGSGEINIRVGGVSATTINFPLGTIENSNVKIILYYDGTYYRSYGMFNGYNSMRESEIKEATSTSNRVISPVNLKYAVETHAPVQSVNGQTGDVTVNDVKVSATAPSSPIEGMMWYDTTNDQLKVYDGTNWNVTGKEYNAGPGIEIGTVQDYSAMRGPAPDGYHVPSKDEWVALRNVGVSLGVWTSSDGTPVKTYLKMPFAGHRVNESAGVYSQGTNGYYWSSTGNSASTAYSFDASSTALLAQSASNRAEGLTLRCFKDVPVIPDSSWTTLYQGTGSAGIFRSSSLGLISLSSDGTTWTTIQDKNLGATTVYNDGDTLSEANCGKYYQRGNNYGFPFTGTVTTSSTQVDASGYGPGNYYLSDTFITGSSNWSSVRNDNLRGGVTGVVTLNNAITNTGVTSVNGQTGDVVIDGGNTKTFYLSSTSDLTTAQEAYDWIQLGNEAIIEYNNVVYLRRHDNPNVYLFRATAQITKGDSTIIGTDSINYRSIQLLMDGSTVSSIVFSNNSGRYIDANTNYSTPYTPKYNGSPATKKYVDDHAGITNNTTGTTTTVSQVWAGTESEYVALSSKSNNIIYFTY